jgi:hypothetical protein
MGSQRLLSTWSTFGRFLNWRTLLTALRLQPRCLMGSRWRGPVPRSSAELSKETTWSLWIPSRRTSKQLGSQDMMRGWRPPTAQSSGQNGSSVTRRTKMSSWESSSTQLIVQPTNWKILVLEKRTRKPIRKRGADIEACLTALSSEELQSRSKCTWQTKFLSQNFRKC